MRAATKLRAEQIQSIAYVDNELPEPQPKPDQGLPGHQPYPDQTLPGSQPHPDQSLPGAQPHPDQGLPGEQPRPDNTLPGSQPRPDNTLPGQPVYPDNTLPPVPARPYPEYEGAVLVFTTTGGEVVVVPTDGLTYSGPIEERPEATPYTQVSMTPAGQPIYPSYTTAGGGSLGAPVIGNQLPEGIKAKPTDWLVVDYDIVNDAPIRRVVDDETFKRYFKISMSG